MKIEPKRHPNSMINSLLKEAALFAETERTPGEMQVYKDAVRSSVAHFVNERVAKNAYDAITEHFYRITENKGEE